MFNVDIWFLILELTSTTFIDTNTTSVESTEHSLKPNEAKEENKPSFSKCSRHDITHPLVCLENVYQRCNACFNTFKEHEGA